jgi:hypothetical protein
MPLQDTFTEGNYRLIFGLALDVLLRPWEKFIIGLRFSEVGRHTSVLSSSLICPCSWAPFGLTMTYAPSQPIFRRKPPLETSGKSSHDCNKYQHC